MLFELLEKLSKLIKWQLTIFTQNDNFFSTRTISNKNGCHLINLLWFDKRSHKSDYCFRQNQESNQSQVTLIFYNMNTQKNGTFEWVSQFDFKNRTSVRLERQRLQLENDQQLEDEIVLRERYFQYWAQQQVGNETFFHYWLLILCM